MSYLIELVQLIRVKLKKMEELMGLWLDLKHINLTWRCPLWNLGLRFRKGVANHVELNFKILLKKWDNAVLAMSQ